MSTRCTLLIGGGGFIGRAVARALVGRRRVAVLDIGSRPPSGLPEEVAFHTGDFSDPATLDAALEGVEEVVHLAYASVPKTSFEHPVDDILRNLPPVVGLFEELVKRRVGKVVLVSSGGTVYGQAHYLPIDEKHPTFPISPYGITKLTVEKYGLMYRHHQGLPLVIVRPANPFGEEQAPFRGQGFVSTAMASVMQGKDIVIFGKTGIVRDYLHVDDVAAGIAAALEEGLPGEIYNIGSGRGHSNQDLLAALAPLAHKAGLPIRIHEEPARPFDVLSNVLDCSKLAAHAGWKPSLDFSEALERTWDHLALTWRT